MQCTLRTNPGRQQIVNQAPTQTATSSKNSWPRRLHALDASRGLAALTVVIWHWQHFFYTNTAPAVDFRRDNQPLYSALKLFYEQGKWGVEYFFILSGFIFFWIYHDAIKERSIRAKEFFVHRFSRLYPLHAVTLFLVALLQAYHTNLRGHPFTYPENDFYHLTLNLFFASHWGLQKGWSFNAPSWSVSVEILLYAAFFVICTQKLGKPSLIYVTSVGIFILNFYIIHSDILRGFSAFLVGGSTYYLARLITDRLPELANHSIAACMASWAIVIAITYAPYQIYPSTPSIIQESFPMYVLFPLTILSITIIEVRGKLNARKVAWLGTISYSSYLLHFPLQIIFALSAAAGLIPRGFQASTIYLILFYAILILLSRFTYNWLEMPSQRYIRDRLLPTSSRKA